MRVNIRRVDSLDIPRSICSLQVELFDTVDAIKYKIYELTNIPPAKQSLIVYQDDNTHHVLTEGETCSAYPIVDGTDIMLVVLEHVVTTTGVFEECKLNLMAQIPSIWLNPLIKVFFT
jgi:hypothetical protein